jgi:threonine/homoserine/homoserine lactone efflux protein
MDVERLIPFLVAVAIVELTPGPNMGYLAVVSGQWGRRAGLLTVLGVTAGLAVYMLAAVLGLTEVVLRVRWLYDLLRWAGVLFLLWLAFDTWRGGRTEQASLAEEPPPGWRLMGRGFLANILNPKALVFYVGLLPGFTDPERPFAPQALTLGVIHIAVSVAVHGAIVAAAAKAIPLLGAGGRLRGAFALLLAAIALWLAWGTRS